MNEIKKKTEDIINYVRDFLKKYGWCIFLIVFLIFYGLMIIHEAFYQDIYISPDSTRYLHEAEALIHGYGMNEMGLSGGYGWFAKWPIGYPSMIAFFMFLLKGHSSYLASKFVAIFAIGIMLLLFSYRHREYSWIFALILLNPGLLLDYYHTWSEVPFVPFLIVFSLGITYILCEKKPSKFHYFILFIGTIGSFFVRYFGIFTLIYLVIVWCGLFLVFFFADKRKNVELRNKLIGIFLVGFFSTILEGAYLVMNHMKCGLATGVERERFTDDIVELTNNLFGALTIEVRNSLQLEYHPLFRYISGGSQRVLAIMIFAGLIVLLYKRRKFDEVFAFISVGIFYYLVFIYVRYHSTMDTFSSRFFAPASVLIMIGLVICLKEYLIKKQIKLYIVMAGIFVFLFLSCISLYQIDKGRKDGAFYQFSEAVNSSLEGVPEKSMVLNVDFDENRWSVIRPDVYLSEIKEGESNEELLERAASYDYVCIKKSVFFDVIMPQDIYSESVKSFLKDGLQNSDDENQYIVIRVSQ